VEPGEHLLDAVEKVSLPTTRLDLRDAQGHEPVFGISRFVPVQGDDVLPLAPLDALKNGAGANVDLLIGTNAEEMNLYFIPTGVREKVGRLLATYIFHRVHPHARKLLKAYGMGRKGVKPGHAFTDAAHDLVFRWPARRFAEEHRGRTHMYEFEWRSPLFGGLGAIDGSVIGASLDHAVTTSQISVAEVWDVRRTLEMRIAALAAERRSDEQAEQILALAEAMVHDQGNMALVTAHDTAFHQILAASTGNMLFTQIVRSFAPQMEIAVPRAWETRHAQDQKATILSLHRRIAQAIAEKNPSEAVAAMEGHFDASIGDLLPR
jgi:hypothetical protein